MEAGATLERSGSEQRQWYTPACPVGWCASCRMPQSPAANTCRDYSQTLDERQPLYQYNFFFSLLPFLFPYTSFKTFFFFFSTLSLLVSLYQAPQQGLAIFQAEPKSEDLNSPNGKIQLTT